MGERCYRIGHEGGDEGNTVIWIGHEGGEIGNTVTGLDNGHDSGDGENAITG